MQDDYLILGGGGHALVLADLLLHQNRHLLGYAAPTDTGELCPGTPWLGTDATLGALLVHHPSLCLVNGLGSVGRITQRADLYTQLDGMGFRFATLRHPLASIATQRTELGPGHQVLAGAAVSPDVCLGSNVLINTRAVIEHGCRIGDHTHVASGAIVCGDCTIGARVHIGAGAVIVQGIQIGSGAVIAAGAVVTQNVEPLTLVAGVPARMKRRFDEQALAGHHDRL